ncbi:MAG: hypothetical protein J2P21_16595 [Chloracidobacterium sp.]|nr:hypothetical protein [Chloracidobacterium sp.]
MDLKLVERIADAVLYEGYMLYPFRPTTIKNRRRFNFGVVYPQNYGLAHDELFCAQTECLAVCNWRMALDVRVRFLHLTAREGLQEAVGREVNAPALRTDLLVEPFRTPFNFPAKRANETCEQEQIHGYVEIAAEQVAERVFKITTRIMNLTPLAVAADVSRDEALKRSLVSTHSILSVRGGEFISLLDPPESFREMAGSCRNIGTYPVLVGAVGERDTMLASPIVLYDYPQIAPESAGDLLEGIEIDEMLPLRILGLTDEEKRDIRDGDKDERRIPERIEVTPTDQQVKRRGAARASRGTGGDVE